MCKHMEVGKCMSGINSMPVQLGCCIFDDICSRTAVLLHPAPAQLFPSTPTPFYPLLSPTTSPSPLKQWCSSCSGPAFARLCHLCYLAVRVVMAHAVQPTGSHLLQPTNVPLPQVLILIAQNISVVVAKQNEASLKCRQLVRTECLV
jgi:hypothetical protein